MAKFEGFLYYVLLEIGSKSEGPDYQLQMFDYKINRVIKKSLLFQPDPMLNKFVHQKVVIEGTLTKEGIEYQNITAYKPA